MNNNLVPSLRFAAFDGDWEKRRFSDLAETRRGLTYSPDDVRDSGIRVLRSSNISEDCFTFGEDDVLVAPEAINIPFAKNGDILITAANGSTRLVGKHAIIKGVAEESAVHGGFMLLASAENPDFVNALMSAPWYSKFISLYVAGGNGAIGNLNKSDLDEQEIVVPSDPEQKAIGLFFSKLDELTSQYQSQYERLLHTKNAMLLKMFPRPGETVPEIRFSGFSSPWKRCKWVETVDISTEMVDPTSGEYDDMPHIAPGNIESFTGRILDNVKTVKEEQLISGKFRFRPGDVVYGKINPQLGKYFYATVDGLTSADAYVFNGKNGITQMFLFSLLQTEDFFKYSVSVSKRSGMPKINRDELNAYSFYAPEDEEEQNRIGKFLLSLDELIVLYRNKLLNLSNIKNALLQRMFPAVGRK